MKIFLKTVKDILVQCKIEIIVVSCILIVLTFILTSACRSGRSAAMLYQQRIQEKEEKSIETARESFKVWVKLHGNPKELTFEEWDLANRGDFLIEKD